MTGTIRANFIGPNTGGTLRNLVRGVAAAWANLNGAGTIALRDSENVSSVVDNGTGDYTYNLTNAMSDGDYSLAGFAQDTLYVVPIVTGKANFPPTATAVRVSINRGDNTIVDVTRACINIWGDLA